MRKQPKIKNRPVFWCVIVFSLLYSPKVVRAVMVLNFTPTLSGGIALDLTFEGVTQPDPSQDRWIELILPGGTIKGGGDARTDLYFDDTLASSVMAAGQQITPSYVRLGNNILSEQFFVFLQPGIPTGSVVDMQISATWEAGNLAYSELTPGTYSVSRPRYGDAIVYIAPLLGDFDSDGDVDGSDFLKWQREDKTEASLANWKSNFGANALASGAVLGVPEPTSVSLVCFIFCFLMSCRKFF